MTDKGTCQKHGEFILSEGCLKCLAKSKVIGKTQSGKQEEPSWNPAQRRI